MASTTKYQWKSALIVKTTVSAFFISKSKRRKNVKFKNKNHQAVFNGEAHKMNRQDDVKMAVLYLLTADVQLWNASKKHIRKGNIDLDSIRVKNSNLKAYTLLCIAKDIACGTCFLSLHDLGDTDLITPKMFGTITTALKIRRYGLNGNKNNNEQENENA